MKWKGRRQSKNVVDLRKEPSALSIQDRSGANTTFVSNPGRKNKYIDEGLNSLTWEEIGRTTGNRVAMDAAMQGNVQKKSGPKPKSKPAAAAPKPRAKPAMKRGGCVRKGKK